MFDGDMNFTTSNEIIMNGIKKLPALDCDSYSGSKILNPTKEQFKEGIKNSFGCAVGSITNWGSAAYDLLSMFKEGTDEYLEIEKRIQSIQMIQQLSIDACKQGKKPKPIPSFWKSNKVKMFKEGSRTDKSDFYEKLIVDKKPYFFRYIYEDTNRKYKKWLEECDILSIRKLGITFEELKNKKNKTLVDKNILDMLNRRCPVTDYNGVVNKIAHYVEDSFKEEFDKNIINKSKENFDYTVYFYNNYTPINYTKKEINSMDISEDKKEELNEIVKYEKTVRNKINKCYEEYKTLVKQKRNTVDETSKEDGQDNTNIMYETLRNELKSIIPNTKELTNIMIDMAYRTKKISVIYLWNMFGVEILDNMLINSNYKIKYPVLNEEEKEFEYEGYGFKMEEKNIRRYLG